MPLIRTRLVLLVLLLTANMASRGASSSSERGTSHKRTRGKGLSVGGGGGSDGSRNREPETTPEQQPAVPEKLTVASGPGPLWLLPLAWAAGAPAKTSVALTKATAIMRCMG